MNGHHAAARRGQGAAHRKAAVIARGGEDQMFDRVTGKGITRFRVAAGEEAYAILLFAGV